SGSLRTTESPGCQRRRTGSGARRATAEPRRRLGSLFLLISPLLASAAVLCPAARVRLLGLPGDHVGGPGDRASVRRSRSEAAPSTRANSPSWQSADHDDATCPNSARYGAP